MQGQLARGTYHSPEEVIEHALEALAEKKETATEAAARHEAVHEMLDFAQKHRFTLGGLKIKDMLHEGHR